LRLYISSCHSFPIRHEHESPHTKAGDPSAPLGGYCCAPDSAWHSASAGNAAVCAAARYHHPHGYAAGTAAERVLFSTFLFTGFREQEGVHLFWSDINFSLNTIRVTAKPELGFWPKRWEEREVPVLQGLIDLLRDHPRRDQGQNQG